MPQPKNTTQTSNFKGFTNKQCEFFPCHTGVEKDFNCLFCYCPLAFLECPGPYEVYRDSHGLLRKDCSACKLNHDGIERSWKFIQRWLEVPALWEGEPQDQRRLQSAVEVEHPRKNS